MGTVEVTRLFEFFQIAAVFGCTQQFTDLYTADSGEFPDDSQGTVSGRKPALLELAVDAV
jgi:hypothetical protein